MLLSEEILHTPASPHHCIHNTHTLVDILQPPYLPKVHLYIISSKNIIIQCILWRTGKTGKRWILLYLTDIPNAPVLDNRWIHMECMHMLLFGNTLIFFSNIYELFFETLVFVSLWERDFLVPGSLYYTSECTGMILLSDHQKTLLSPARFVRLSWLYIVQWQWEMGWYIKLCPE